MEQPSIHTIAIGMQNESEVRFNCAVFSGIVPDEATVAQLEAQPRQLLIHDWCTGCGACVKRCRNHALTLKDDKAAVDTSQCALCGYCAAVCPQFCIKVI